MRIPHLPDHQNCHLKKYPKKSFSPFLHAEP